MPDFLVRLAADWNPAVTSTRQFIQQIAGELQKLNRLNPTARAAELRRGEQAITQRTSQLEGSGALSARDAERVRRQGLAQLQTYQAGNAQLQAEELAARRIQNQQLKARAAQISAQSPALAQAAAEEVRARAEEARAIKAQLYRIRPQGSGETTAAFGARLSAAQLGEKADDIGARARSTEYVTATGRLATERARLAEQTALELATSREYLTATAGAAAARNEQRAAEARARTTVPNVQAASGRLLAEERERRAVESARLAAGTPADVRSRARLQLDTERNSRSVEAARLGGVTRGDIQGRAAITVEQERQKVAEALARDRLVTDADVQATADQVANKRRNDAAVQAAVDRQLVSDTAYQQTKAESIALTKRLNEEIQLAARAQSVGEQPRRAASVRPFNAEELAAQQAAQTRAEQARRQAFAQAREFERQAPYRQRTTIALERGVEEARTTGVPEHLAAAQKALDNFVSGVDSYARGIRRAEQEAAKLTGLPPQPRDERGRFASHPDRTIPGETQDAFAARVVTAERLQAARRQLEVSRALATVGEEELRIEAETRLLDRQRQRAVNQATQQLIRQRVSEGTVSGGSSFQKLQAFIAGRQGGSPKLPEEYLNLGQFASSRALTTAGFAVSGLATYGAFSGIRQSIQQAAELQGILANLREQLNATDKAADFKTLRSSILQIARDTGASTTEVAQVALQMKGAFDDTTVAIKATDDAIKVMRVTGIDAATAVNDLVALAKSFNTSIEHASDLALVMQDRFGIMSKEILNGMAVLAPVAQQVGLTIQQTAGLVAASAQVSGRSASATAEQFNRILPALGEQAVQIIGLYRSIPSLQAKAPQIAQNFGTGDYGKVLVELIRDSKQMTTEQQNLVLQLAGGRREAQALAGALQQPDKIIQAMEGHLGEAGRTTRSFNAIQQTLVQQLSELKRVFEQIGVSILRLGLANALHDIGLAVGGLLALLGGMLRFLGDVNEATHGWAGRLAEVVVALRLVSGLIVNLKEAGIATLFQSALAGRGAAGGIVMSRSSGGGGAGGGLLTAGVLGRVLGAGGGGAAAAEGGGATGLLGTLFGSGAGIAGTAVTAAGLGIVGAAAAGIGYAAWRASANRNAREMTDKLKALDKEQLQKVADTRASFWSAVGNYLTGDQTKDLLASRELHARTAVTGAQQLSAASQAKLIQGLSKQQIKAAFKEVGNADTGIDKFNITAGGLRMPITEITSADVDELVKQSSEKGKKGATTLVDALLRQVVQSPGGGNALSDAIQKYAAGQSEADAKKAVQSGQALQDQQTLKQAYQAGVINTAAYLDSLRAIQKDYELLGPGMNPQEQQAYASLLREIATTIGTQVEQARDLQVEIAKAEGTYTPQTAINLDLAALNRTDIDPQTRYKFVKDLIQRESEQRDALIKNAKSASDVVKALDTKVTIPPAARAVELKLQIDENSSQWQAFWNAAKVAGVDQYLTAATVADIAVKTGQTAKQVVTNQVAKLDGLIQVMQRAGADAADINALRKQRDDLAQQAAGLPDVATPGGDAGGDSAQVNETAAAKIVEIGQRQVDFVNALANGNALKIAKNNLDRANNDIATLGAHGLKDTDAYKEATTRRQTAINDYAQAQYDRDQSLIELSKVQDEFDPVAAASDALRSAQAELAKAGDDATKVAQAKAHILQAQRQATDATLATTKAHFDLLRAIREAAGDSVGAAEIDVKSAQAALQNAKDKGVTGVNLEPYEADLKRAQAALRDQDLQTKENRIDVQRQLLKITTAQAIAQFEALLQIPGLTIDEINDINLKIKQLKDEAGRDLQFDIPSQIDLPTLYESRRAKEAGSAGYQDNRSIVFSEGAVQINNGMDQSAAEAMLARSLGVDRRVMTTTSRRV